MADLILQFARRQERRPAENACEAVFSARLGLIRQRFS